MRRAALPINDLTKAAHTFAFYRNAEAKATREKNGARDIIKGWLTMRNKEGVRQNGREDENGNRFLDLEEPLVIGGDTITGIKAERKTSPVIDEEAVEAALKDRDDNAYDMVFKRVVIREFDEDALFVLNQRGVISDEQMESFIDVRESFALKIVTE